MTLYNSVLCLLGYHKWKKIPDQTGQFDHGYEWMESWDCQHCQTTSGYMKGYPKTYRVTKPGDKYYRPHTNGVE